MRTKPRKKAKLQKTKINRKKKGLSLKKGLQKEKQHTQKK